MRRLAAIFGGLLAVLTVPLALSAPTALFLLPAHGLLTAVASVGAIAEGAAGHPTRARLWGAFYLVVTATMVATLELSTTVRSASWMSWVMPYAAVLVWGWIPPVVSGFSGLLGVQRRRRLSARAVAKRRGSAE